MVTDMREKKKPEPAPEVVEGEVEETHRVTLVIHTSSRDDFKLKMGTTNAEGIQNINSVVAGAFNTVRVADVLTLISEDNIVHHFNVNQVVCVEVQVS